MSLAKPVRFAWFHCKNLPRHWWRRATVGFPAVALALLVASGCQSVGMPGNGSSPPYSPPDLPPTAGVPGPAPEPSRARSGLPALTLPTETGDVRALWVVRTALLHPDSARAAVRRADEAGFNTLLVQVRGRGDAYYESAHEPRAEPLAGTVAGYDPLTAVLDEAGRREMRVHAWLNMHVVASAYLPPQDSRHVARARPDWLAVPRELAADLFSRDPRTSTYFDALIEHARANGDRVEGLYTSPANPDVQAHLERLVEDLVMRYPVDGVHLDYLRFPSADFDYSKGSLEAFRRWVRAGGADRIGGGGSLRDAETRWPGDPFAYTAAFPLLWNEFRRESVTATMERIYRAAKTIRSDLVVSAAVFADADDARASRFQNWERWLNDGILDVAAPMAYTTDQATFRAQIERAARPDPRRIWAGLGIYRDSLGGAVEKGRWTRGAGIGGVVLFSYDWAVGEEGATAAEEGSYLSRFARDVFSR